MHGLHKAHRRILIKVDIIIIIMIKEIKRDIQTLRRERERQNRRDALRVLHQEFVNTVINESILSHLRDTARSLQLDYLHGLEDVHHFLCLYPLDAIQQGAKDARRAQRRPAHMKGREGEEGREREGGRFM